MASINSTICENSVALNQIHPHSQYNESNILTYI